MSTSQVQIRLLENEESSTKTKTSRFTIAKWKRDEGKTTNKALSHDQRIFCTINDFIPRYRLMVVRVYTMIELCMPFHNMLCGRVWIHWSLRYRAWRTRVILPERAPNLGPIRERSPYCSDRPTLFGGLIGKPARLHILIAGSSLMELMERACCTSLLLYV